MSQKFFKKVLTKVQKADIISKSVYKWQTPTSIWSCIEVVITSTIGNRVAVMSGTRVQIPPTPPEKKHRFLSVLFLCVNCGLRERAPPGADTASSQKAQQSMNKSLIYQANYESPIARGPEGEIPPTPP